MGPCHRQLWLNEAQPLAYPVALCVEKRYIVFRYISVHWLEQRGRNVRTEFLTKVSQFLTWTLIFIGLIVQVFAVPELSQRLSVIYQEYAGDQTIIQVMLTVIVSVGQVSLGLISLLLARIKAQKLLSETTLKWVQALATSLLAVAATFTFLLVWLIGKNTLPPSLAGFLLVAILGSTTVALVTLSLKGVLKSAIATQLEMDGVI